MKKKIFVLSTILFTLFSLTSCSNKVKLESNSYLQYIDSSAAFVCKHDKIQCIANIHFRNSEYKMYNLNFTVHGEFYINCVAHEGRRTCTLDVKFKKWHLGKDKSFTQDYSYKDLRNYGCKHEFEMSSFQLKSAYVSFLEGNLYLS